MAKRFWQKVAIDKLDECWLWTANLVNRNKVNQHYGRFRFRGKKEVASRVSYYFAYGPFPAELDVLHTCDIPRCVNPTHLFLGNAKVNGEDMVRKGRSPAGDKHGRAKLDEALALAIYQSATSHQFPSLQATANHFGVTFRKVCDIKYGYLWNCVTKAPKR